MARSPSSNDENGSSHSVSGQHTAPESQSGSRPSKGRRVYAEPPEEIAVTRAAAREPESGSRPSKGPRVDAETPEEIAVARAAAPKPESGSRPNKGPRVDAEAPEEIAVARAAAPEPESGSRPSKGPRVYAVPPEEIVITRADEDESYREYLVSVFRKQLASAAETFVRLSPLQRFRLANLDTLVAQSVSLVGFVTWGSMLPLKRAAAVFGVSPAYAQSGEPPPVLDPRPYIQMAIFAALFVIFLLSIWVNYFGKNPDSAQRADTVAKALLGFFIGASTNYLGLTLRG
jgi:hypothetical protein